jgi:hypothetical protein
LFFTLTNVIVKGNVTQIIMVKCIYKFSQKSKAKRLFGQHGDRWSNDILKDVKEMECMWAGLSWLRTGTGDLCL